MQAAVLHEIGQPLRIENVPVPRIGPDEVLVQTHTCGICRTDIHLQDGLAYVPPLPHVPGHEPAGVVVEVGDRAKDYQAGQRVVPHLFLTCGDCRYCRCGQEAQCARVGGILGVTCGGGFAEYFKVPARNLLRLPDSVPFDAGGLVSCAAITAVHAFRKSTLQADETAVVLGTGGIGIMIVQLLAHSGVRTVAVSRSDASLELASQAGAELTVTSDAPDVADRVREFSGEDGAGVDCVFELVGLAVTMQAAANFVRPGGRIVVIGEEAEFPAVDTVQIAQRELQIIGSRNGGMQDARDALEMMATGAIRPHIAAKHPLAEINEAFDSVRRGEAHGRVVIQLRPD
jgi:propanol-preferring alcohol dehydrogenase